jgi:UDP-4-amino-4,6-dideoxy-N-acetyl-beta-L-altrosamine transaminase
MIPYSRQFIDNQDKKNILKVLSSDFLTTGPLVSKFENNLTKKFKCKYAVVVNSATSALHLSCLALGLKKKDNLWTSPISFVASSNCGLLCGSNIDFIDIDEKTYNISLENLKKKLSSIKNKSKIPKIIVPVHMAGNPVDLIELHKLAKKYRFKILEDASHASGSKLGKSFIGSCKHSDVSVYSFHPVKTITTGEGGAILTNSKTLYKKVKILRNQGIERKKTSKKYSNSKPWHYDLNSLGFNYRMTDIQAALGISQLKKIDKFILKRNQIADYYKKKLSKKINFQHVKKNDKSTYHLFIITVDKKVRNKIIKKLLQLKINTNIHYIPIYRHKYYVRKFNFDYKNFQNSERYYKEAISIPIYYSLTRTQQNKIINIINSFFYDSK